MNDLIHQKNQLRQLYRLRRSDIQPRERRIAESRIFKQVTAIIRSFAPVSCIGGYYPIHNEVDTLKTLTSLRSQGFLVALPKTMPNQNSLTFCLWKNQQTLIDSIWGIKTPPLSAPIVQPNILLVPLIAFDQQGNRLGYGRGFYDRTIAWYRKYDSVYTIGLAFSVQEAVLVPHDVYDQPLDCVVTDHDVFVVKPRINS